MANKTWNKIKKDFMKAMPTTFFSIGGFLCLCVIAAIVTIYIGFVQFNAGLMIAVATAGYSTLVGYGFSGAYSFYILMGIQYTWLTTIGAWFHQFPTQGDWYDWAWQSGILTYAGI